MSKRIPEMLLQSCIFKSQQEIQGFKRCWEKCEPFRNCIESKLHSSRRNQITIGFYPTMQQVGFAVLGPNCRVMRLNCYGIVNVIKACSLDSSFSIISETRQFSKELAFKLKEELIPYANATEDIQLLFQRQPPILGINSEKIRNVLLYSEFVGVLQYECYQLFHSWPEPVHLSDIAYYRGIPITG